MSTTTGSVRVEWVEVRGYTGDLAFSVRRATERDLLELPGVERSAGESFRLLTDLAWIAVAEWLC